MEPQQQQQHSLLDVLQQEKQQATLTRLAVVCPHGSAAAAGSCQGLVAKLAPGKVADGDAGAGAISGLVLLYPCCSLMLLEGELQVLRSVLLDTPAGEGGCDAAAAQQAKVLLITAGLPSRCCRALYAASIHAGSSSCGADAADPAQVVQMAGRAVAAVRKAACHLASLPEAELRRQLASLATCAAEELPGQEQLMALAASEQLPSVADWVRMCAPPTYTPQQLLEDATCWPLPQPVWP